MLRRFTPTPHNLELCVMQRTVRLESNEPRVLDLALKFFRRHQSGSPGEPAFVWRLIYETDPSVRSTEVPVSAFSDSGFRYANVGQRGFVAVDLSRREGTGFISDVFLEEQATLRHRPPLNVLFCMTAPSLGLTPLSGACVGRGDRAVLVFGSPNSGKTTASYLASQAGLDFHADHVVFLDPRTNSLSAWGDLFPAVFRPETLEFLPELRGSCLSSSYGELSFYHLDKSYLQPRQAFPVTPICSVFLDRSRDCESVLGSVEPEEAAQRLRKSVLFEEDEIFSEQVRSSIAALTGTPTYELRYDRDPKIAAEFIEAMLR
jgi:hypothetical protein